MEQRTARGGAGRVKILLGLLRPGRETGRGESQPSLKPELHASVEAEVALAIVAACEIVAKSSQLKIGVN